MGPTIGPKFPDRRGPGHIGRQKKESWTARFEFEGVSPMMATTSLGTPI
jgi:hypothetical protein